MRVQRSTKSNSIDYIQMIGYLSSIRGCLLARLVPILEQKKISEKGYCFQAGQWVALSSFWVRKKMVFSWKMVGLRHKTDINKNTEVRSFKSNEHIHMKVDGPDLKFRLKKAHEWLYNDFATKARGKHATILWISNRQSIQRLIYIKMGSK